ncbi:MAG: hypothetical protein FK734_02265, partial [Asgard group archaeon]|nr:hypothetical protein [Asgard group archaeon]
MFEGQEEIRNKEYPHLKNRVWLNSSAFVPHSMSVVKAMQEMTDYFHLPILGKEAEDYFIKINEEFYQGAGLLLDTSPNNISMVINTAHGLNYPLHGIDWQKRDNVVTCELEFPTNYMPWKYVSKTKGVEFRS